jgi:hypothetical protein
VAQRVTIEHDLDVLRAADWVIDPGSAGGVAGGEVVAEGTLEQVVGRRPVTIADNTCGPGRGCRRSVEAEAKPAFVRDQAVRSRRKPEARSVVWSAHTITELVADRLTRVEVEAGLESGEVIEDYPMRTRPLPDCLVLARLAGGEAIHAVVAVDVDLDRILIVTVYRPEPEEWEDDWRTRGT